jgi:hypothetical protein
MLIILKILLFLVVLAAFAGAMKSTVVNVKFVKRAINRSEKWKQIGGVVWGAFLSIVCFLLLLQIVDWIFRK